MKTSYDRVQFDSPLAAGLGISQVVSRFAGMPVGIELEDRFHVEVWNPGRLADQNKLVDNPSNIDETAAGTEWLHTQFTSSTLTIEDTSFPPYLRISTGTGSTNGHQMQACKGLAGATGAPTTSTRTLYTPITSDMLFFSITCRFLDGANNAATVTEPYWFIGFCPVNAAITSGTVHHIGLAKQNGSSQVYLGSSQGSVNMPWSDTARTPAFDMVQAGVAGKFITLSFLAMGLDVTNQRGTAYAFLDQNNTPLGATNFAPTHVATLDMGIGNSVPNGNMCPSIAYRNTATAAPRTLDVVKIVTAARYKPTV